MLSAPSGRASGPTWTTTISQRDADEEQHLGLGWDHGWAKEGWHFLMSEAHDDMTQCFYARIIIFMHRSQEYG